MKKAVTSVVFVVAAALAGGIFAGGCSSPVEEPAIPFIWDLTEEPGDPPGDGTGTGILSIQLAEPEYGDCYGPDFGQLENFSLEFIRNNGETAPALELRKGETLRAELGPGSWNIRAVAFAPQSAGEEPAEVMEGSTEVELVSGEERGAAIKMGDIPGAGGYKGNLAYGVEFNREVALQAELNLSIEEQTGSYSLVKTLDFFGGAAQQGTLALNPGQYRVEVRVLGPRGLLSETALLRIYPVLTTTVPPVVFTEEDFSRVAEFSDAALLKAYLEDLPENTEENPYLVKPTDFDLSSKESPGNSLKTLIAALTRYVDLDLSACTGGSIIAASSFSGVNRKRVVSVILPDSVSAIAANGFSGYSALITLEGPGVVEAGYGAFKNCAQLSNVLLPNLTSIANASGNDTGAFYACSSLVSIELPKLDQLGDYAFSTAAMLRVVSLPAVRSVGKSAFKNCGNLEAVELNQAASIGNQAFYGATALRRITLGKIPPALASNTIFEAGLPGEGIYIPSESEADYRDGGLPFWPALLSSRNLVLLGT
jgi:hypothetical protein